MGTLILTSLLVSMGLSTFTSKEFVIFCKVSKIGNGGFIHHRFTTSGMFFCLMVYIGDDDDDDDDDDDVIDG